MTPAGAVPASPHALIVLAMTLAAFVLNLNTNVMGALLPFLGEGSALALDAEQKVWLLSAAAGASAVGALLVGPVADRRGRRGPLVSGLLVFTLASAAHGLVDSFALLLALRVVTGLGVGVAYACASAVLTRTVPYHRRGAAMGTFTAGMFLAVPVGLPLAVLFARNGDWRTIFWVQAGCGAVALVLAARTTPGGDGEGHGISYRRVLGRPGVLAALLATMLHVGSFFTTVQLAGDWLHDAGLLQKAQQGQLWVVLGLASAAGSVVLGRIGDRIGKRNFVLLTSIGIAACFVLLGRVHDLAGLWPVGIGLSLVAAARTGPLHALVSGLAPGHEQTTLMGLRAAAQQAGVWLFAVAMVPVYASAGFAAVALAAAGCQALSYAAIRFGVKERS